MNKPIYLLVLLSLLLLAGCGPGAGAGSFDLEGTSWTLVSYGGNSLLPETSMTADFKKGEISGSASCNHYFGSYQIKNDNIEIEGLGWTEMACLNPEGIMEQEQTLMKLLTDAANITVSDQNLELMTRDGTLLIFHPLNSFE